VFTSLLGLVIVSHLSPKGLGRFNLVANNRRNKNYIRSLRRNDNLLSSQQDKLQEAHQHFKEILGETRMRHKVVQWAALDYSPFPLGELDNVIHDSEIKNVVMSLHSEKAPGLDGFIGLFYKCCWALVKEDLTAAINDFYNYRYKNLHLVNEANVVLLPKKEVSDSIEKFRPISLINSFMKIVTKILANRLAPRMNEIVSVAQNAFIQKLSIHDNFLYVQRVIMKMHKRGQPALFIKLDISRAFDSINWAYLFDVLRALGFSQRWRDWIALILGLSSSKIIINGEQTNRINHKRGVRQGDPLSPFLFILAMDPLQRMIDKVAQSGLLGTVLPKGAKLHCSLYADDAGVFVRADNSDLKVLKMILEVFEGCSGLKINFDKTEIFPIRYPESLG
jgi:hypothetical protein